MDIAEKVVIITGASSGIGEAAARLLSRRGGKVVLAARRADRLQRLESELAGSFAVVTDVTRSADIDNLVARTLERFGRIDVLVNNAGQGLHMPIEQVAIEDYRAIIELNVVAPLRLMQSVVPHMRRQGEGAIVNISSGTTRMVLPGLGAYASTKAALNMLSQVARAELAADGIVVSLVYPYITETDFHSSSRAASPANDRIRASMPRGHSAEFVAEHILRSIETGEAEIVLSPLRPQP